MRKIISMILFTFIISLFSIINVNAKILTPDEIDPMSHIIGTHMFTTTGVTNAEGYPGLLTAQTMMLAANTISNPTLDEMIVYYKKDNGVWIDELTGNEVTFADGFTFNITHHNLVEQPGIYVNTADGLQEAINNASENDVINLLNGTYNINLDILNKNNITILGAGDSVIIKQPTTSRTAITADYQGANPIIYIDNSKVTLKNIIVEGATLPLHKEVDGITSINSDLTLENVTIRQIKNSNGFSGSQYGRGLTARGSNTNTIIVKDSEFTDFNKNGIHLFGVTANIDGTEFYGGNELAGQNGIVFHDNATGSVSNSAFINFNNSHTSSWGILIFTNKPVTLTNNIFTNTGKSIYHLESQINPPTIFKECFLENNKYICEKEISPVITGSGITTIKLKNLDTSVEEDFISGSEINTDGNYQMIINEINASQNPVIINFEINLKIKMITTSSQLEDAINRQRDNQIWNLASGIYDLSRNTSLTYNSQTGWYFLITANNLQIIGAGNVTITSSEPATLPGNHSAQNFITIVGNNVTLKNLTIISKTDVNKVIEVYGQNLKLNQINIEPPTGTSFAGSIYFNVANIGDVTIKDVNLNKARFTFTGATDGNIEFNNVSIDYTGVTSAYVNYFPFWSVNGKNINVTASNLNVKLDDTMSSYWTECISHLPPGTSYIKI